MAEIVLSEPNGPYKCSIDTQVMEVQIKKAFLGVGFVTEDGEHLSVSMRDSGYEIRHFGEGFDSGWIEMKSGDSPPAVPLAEQPAKEVQRCTVPEPHREHYWERVGVTTRFCPGEPVEEQPKPKRCPTCDTSIPGLSPYPEIENCSDRWHRPEQPVEPETDR